MKESYWGYWLILLGVFVIVIMMLISSITTQNTEDYYLVKEVTEAAMVDAINYGYYRKYGELKIDREKFIESFLRRFAENVSFNTYEISFYDIYEAPPKVSVKVTSKSKSFVVAGDSATFDIVNKVDAVLELSGQNDTSIFDLGTNQYVDEATTLRVPKNLKLYTMYQYETLYYDCQTEVVNGNKVCTSSPVLKEKYKNDGDLFAHDVLINYQKIRDIKLTQAEKSDFYNIFKNTACSPSVCKYKGFDNFLNK